MRIAVVCHEASLTGAPRIGFDVAASLAERHETTLLVKRGGPLIDFPRYAGLRDGYRCLDTSHEVSGQTYRQRVDGARAVLEELAPDVLYVNSVASGDWCEAGARTGIPVALHTHETRDSLPGLLSSVCTPRVLRWTDLLVGASRGALEDIEELTGTVVRRHFELGIFVDADTVLEQSQAQVSPPVTADGMPLPDSGTTERPAVGMCGLAQPRKGADLFFEVARRLPDCDFVWIGPWAPPETDLNGATVERFRQERLPNFYVTGLVDNPYAHLHRIDAFVLTSREDPNPLVIAEALLLDKAVLAFSGTGASAAALARFGYAFTGPPDADRIVAMLPRILAHDAHERRREGPERLRSEVRAEYDGAGKLRALEEALERLAATPAAPSAAVG